MFGQEIIREDKDGWIDVKYKDSWTYTVMPKKKYCNSVQREHDKKLNNGLPILHMIPPYRDYGRYFCIMAEKGGTM